MNDYRERFQELLRQLFQFDSADLDFGIYRIMNFKRDVIEQFIQKDLLDAVSSELEKGALAEQSTAVKELEEVKQEIVQNISDDALDDDGNLAETYRDTRLGKKYLELKDKATGAKSRPAIEAAIFNHLYTFFSRYYDNGDFMSKRRYSKKEKYAIPYNGEEVYLHWANSDQYYIKTGEYFTKYSFKSNDITVRFELRNADVEQDNVKGDKRFFLSKSDQVTYNKESQEIVIPFEYRPLTEKETITYGQRNQQDVVIAAALKDIPSQFEGKSEPLSALMVEKRRNSEGKSVSALEHHLRRYTRRNTSDFFIHKNLKGFLERELDFYLKNEVLNLDELEIGGESRAEGWFQMMRVLKAIGHKIITFVAQIENFQKRLFEKKKFITETNYCITLNHISEEFYEEIAANEAQRKEWVELFAIDVIKRDTTQPGYSVPLKVDFIKALPTLVVDTKHYNNDFKARLLASYEDIDAETDGLLIHSENFQALNLMLEKYRKKISCIHIDPPYNTQTSGFLYKNDYQHSSWLSMMENRINAGSALMSQNGSYLCHIDENEYERLQLMFEHFAIPDSGTIAWDKRNPMNAGRGVATQHEYIIWRSGKETPIYLRNENILLMLKLAAELVKIYGFGSIEAQREFTNWIDSNTALTGGEKAYRYLDEQGRIYQSVSLRAPEPRTDPKFHIPLIHPVTGKSCPIPPNGFSRTPETLQNMILNHEIIFGEDENTQPRQKVILTEQKRRQITSVIQDGHKGKADVDRLGLNFPYCHPVSLYEELVAAATDSQDDIALDYFAGSGTTGHAAINLNRFDKRRCKFFLVELDDCFDRILLLRIKKVTFTPEWKDGKPKRMATDEEAASSPRIVKYIRLESYEDALNNIAFDGDAAQQAMRFDDYLLNYMLDFETKESETFLNIDKLASPFSYKLTLTEEQETTINPVDLSETFNYMIGLWVKTQMVYMDDDRKYMVYRGTVDHQDVVVIWRETKDWEKEDFERDKDFVEEQGFTKGADIIYANSDSFIKGAESLDPVFKRKMFEGVN